MPPRARASNWSTNSSLEAVRRGGHIALMLALLIGLPLPVFLIGGNLVWAAVFAASIVPLLNAGALAPRLRHFWRALAEFWRLNRPELTRSGTYAGAELIDHL